MPTCDPRPARWRARSLLGLAMLAGAGLLLLAGLIAGSGVASVIVALVAALVPVWLLVWLVRHLDRFGLEPRRLLAVTFLYGATAAVVLAGLFNSAGASVLAERYDPAATQALAVAGVAPLVEELLKGAAVLVVAWRHRSAISSVLDGVVYGAMIGLGFAFTENVAYYVQALGAGGEAFTATVVTRTVLMPVAHPLFTVLVGIGLAVAVQSGRWLLPPALGLLGAMGLHALWNAAALTGQGVGVVYVWVLLPVLAFVAVVTLVAMHRQRRLLRRHLDEEVTAQRLMLAELATLTSPRRRRRAERRAAAAGPEALRARHSFHHAATRLAFVRHRRRSGHGTRAPSAEVEAFWLAETQRCRRHADGLELATRPTVHA